MTASKYYEDIVVTSYNGGDLYLYQEFPGLQYVRMVSGESVTFSAEITNVSGVNIAVYFGINRYYNPGNDLVRSRSINLEPGRNIIGTTIENIARPSVMSVGAAPTLQARMYLSEFDASCHLKVHYIKAEFGRVATVNFTDNFIEQARIANF